MWQFYCIDKNFRLEYVMEKVLGVILLFVIGFGLRYLMRTLMRGAFRLTGNAVRKIANKGNNNREDQNDSDKPAARYID